MPRGQASEYYEKIPYIRFPAVCRKEDPLTILLRIYFLTGLIGHKLVWEMLKRRRGAEAPERHGPSRARQYIVKTVKIGVLLGIMAQTLVPAVLPIAGRSSFLPALGAAIYTLGLLTAVSARIQLGRNWSNIETARVLSGQAVVSGGIYRYIRHPIYTGDLLLLAGLELGLNSWLVAGLALLAPIVIWKALREEKMLAEGLPGYLDYCRQSKRFIPLII